VRRRGTEVRIAEAAKDLKHGVIWQFVVESMIGNVIVDGRRWAPVEKNNSSG
jgi:hypothetical protein